MTERRELTDGELTKLWFDQGPLGYDELSEAIQLCRCAIAADRALQGEQAETGYRDNNWWLGWNTAIRSLGSVELVAWWRISYVDDEGNSDADVQIGKDKPTTLIMADNGFEWKPLYGIPLAARDAQGEEQST